MSPSVDQRVVQMQFDNSQFERNVSTTMSTLGKLKQSLNLSGASKGLENVGTAARGINLSGLSNAAETVAVKFSYMQMTIQHQLNRIVDSAVSAGKRMVSALTIDPIKTGLSEYETQINAVQTILANTESKGTTLGQVNAALDELNTYADKTIYNFTEMTRNIGTFTAAGVDLKTSVQAIQGIANLAAVSGSNSQQASTAMYQLSQALSSGTVKLMDWNSVVNAGMGGQVFQDALKTTSRNMLEKANALNKMSEAQLEAYKTEHGYTDEQIKSMKAYNTNIDELIDKKGSFRETLQEGWLTADVLTETLSHFTMAAEEGSKQWEKYKQALIDDGYTEEQAKAILKLSNTATNAATKVKTATQLWDTLKETAQSGWTQTWEIILGDFGEAKELFSGIYETLSPIIEATSEARNALLSGGLSSGWKQLLGEGISDEEGYRDSIKAVAKEHGISIDNMIAAQKKLDSSLDDNEAFQKVLTKGLKKGYIDSDMLTESVTHLADKMRNMTEAEREAAGYTEEHITKIEELEAGLKSGKISMEEFVEKMQKPSGRENIIEGLMNSFNGLMNIIKPVKEAFRDIFPAMTSEQIYGFTENFKALTVKFKEFGTKYADQIKRTFKGLFSIIDIGKKIFTAFGNSISDLVKSSGVSSLGDYILNSLASIGDFFTTMNENFDVAGVSDIFSKLASGISSALGKSVDILKDFGRILPAIGDVICDAASAIWNGVKSVFGWISDHFSVGDIFAGLAGGGIFVLAKKLMGFVKQLSELFDGGLMGALFGKGGDKEDSGSIKDKISELFDGVGEAIQGFTSSIKVGSFVAIAAAIAILASAFDKLSELNSTDICESLITMGAALGMMMLALNHMPTNKTFATSLFGMTETTSLIKSGIALMLMAEAINILAEAILKMSDLSWEEIAKGLTGVGGGLVLLCGGLKVLDGAKVSLGTSIAMLALAEACKILGDAMQKFVGFSWDEIFRGLAGMGGALAELVAALSILSKVGGLGSVFGATGILIAVQGLAELAEGLKSFADMSWPEIGRGLAGMGGALAELAIVLGLLSKISTVKISGGIAGTLGGIFGKAGASAGASAGLSASINGLSTLFSAGAIWVVIQGLKDLADAFKDFSEMSWPEIGAAAVAMGTALAEVAASAGILGHLAGFSGIFGAGAIWVVIQGLSDLAEAFKSFGEMSWGEIARAVIAMGEALGQVGIVAGLLGYLAGFAGILGGAAIWVTVQGLSDLATAFAQFGEMSWPEIGRGIVAMGAALLEVGAISGALGYLAGFAGILGGAAIWTAVQGLGDLADAFKKFGEMSWEEIGSAMVAMGSALTELALGGFFNTLSLFGAISIAEVAEPLGVLAESVKKWSDVTVPEGLAGNLTKLGQAVLEFTFGGWGAGAIADVAEPLGTLADSVQKWSGVTVPEDIGTSLTSLADGIYAFTFGGLGASALSEAAPGIGTMADSVAKWAGVTVPEDIGTSLTSLATGVKAFTFGGSGAGSLAEAAAPLGTLADSVTKWAGVTIPEDLASKLSTLAYGVKAFTFGGSGAESIATCATSLGVMAESVTKWTGVTVPENLGTNLSTLSTAIKSFTWRESGSENLSTAATGVGAMADAVKKWSGVTIPEGFSDDLSSLSAAVKDISGIDDLSGTVASFGSLAGEISKLAGISYSNINDGLTGLATSISGLDSSSSSLSGLGDTIASELVTPLKNAAEDLSSVGTTIVNSISTGIKNGISSLTSAGKSAASAIVDAIKSKSKDFTSVGKTLATNLVDGIDNKKKSASNAGKTIASQAVTGARDKYGSMVTAGTYLGLGFIAGIASKAEAAYNAGYALGAAAAKGVEDGEQAASPSKLGIRAGKWLGEGFVIGIDRMGGAVYNAGLNMGSEAIDSVSNSVRSIADLVASDIDAQPTIRPVLDLSDIHSGASTLGSLFGTQSVGLSAVGSISTMMNRRSQNGATNEVVTAIDKLRKDLGNVGNTSYNINGISYDRGSELDDAVRTIVRYAKLEGRV